MSRIGKKPVDMPKGVTFTVSKDNVVTVKGPKGELTQPAVTLNGYKDQKRVPLNWSFCYFSEKKATLCVAFCFLDPFGALHRMRKCLPLSDSYLIEAHWVSGSCWYLLGRMRPKPSTSPAGWRICCAIRTWSRSNLILLVSVQRPWLSQSHSQRIEW